MDWSNERYVRVYTRDTVSWKLMDWRGRAVLQLLLRKVDRAGVLDVGHDGVLGLAAVLEMPIDIVEAGIVQLTTARGGMPTVVDTGTAYVLPNFLEAQEAPQADSQRKRESRSRRRDVALAVSRKILMLSAGETTGHETGHTGHETDRDRDERSQPVTPILPVPVPPQTKIEDPPPARAPTIPVTTQPSTVDVLWDELELERQRVSAHHRITHRPMVAHDAGRSDLANALVDSTKNGKRDLLISQARHAIAVAGAEAQVDRSKLQWLTGAIFQPKNFRRLAVADLAQARTPPRAKGDPLPPAPAPRREVSAPAIVIPPDEREDVAAMARKLLDRLNGTARAPPRSADPTSEHPDQQPQPKAAP